MFVVAYKCDNNVDEVGVAATIEGAEALGCQMILKLILSGEIDLPYIIDLIKEKKYKEALESFEDGYEEVIIKEAAYFTETELLGQLENKLKELDIKEIIE